MVASTTFCTTFVTLISFQILTGVWSITIEVKNKCTYTVSPGILSSTVECAGDNAVPPVTLVDIDAADGSEWRGCVTNLNQVCPHDASSRAPPASTRYTIVFCPFNTSSSANASWMKSMKSLTVDVLDLVASVLGLLACGVTIKIRISIR